MSRHAVSARRWAYCVCRLLGDVAKFAAVAAWTITCTPPVHQRNGPTGQASFPPCASSEPGESACASFSNESDTVLWVCVRDICLAGVGAFEFRIDGGPPCQGFAQLDSALAQLSVTMARREVYMDAKTKLTTLDELRIYRAFSHHGFAIRSLRSATNGEVVPDATKN